MDTLAPASFLKYTETELLSFLINYAAENQLPVAFWRLPHSNVKHLLISERYLEINMGRQFEDLGEGFLMAPFDKNKKRFFLPADLFFSFENGELVQSDLQDNNSVEWLSKKIQSYYPEKKNKVAQGFNPSPVENEKQLYIQLIDNCLKLIAEGAFEKIVPSRTKYIDLPETFDVVDCFQKLCKTYSQALISFVSIPKVGKWLGASPELLVSVADKMTFRTVALAGTLPYHEGIPVKSVAWTQKEIEEQALVERYVISCFKRIRLREYEEHGPKTVIAGNLMHLRSDFTVDMKAINFPQLGSVMLQLLHPTSAVCGMPLETSLTFLEQMEGYDRSFYAGYLGPVNIHNNVDLFVNLRCMQILENRGILYAGAGVTIDSIAEEEWQETEIKFNTLLNVIL